MGIDSASVELRVLNKSAFDLPDRSDADADGLEGAIGIQKDRSILGDISLPIARALPSLVRGTGPVRHAGAFRPFLPPINPPLLPLPEFLPLYRRFEFLFGRD